MAKPWNYRSDNTTFLIVCPCVKEMAEGLQIMAAIHKTHEGDSSAADVGEFKNFLANGQTACSHLVIERPLTDVQALCYFAAREARYGDRRLQHSLLYLL